MAQDINISKDLYDLLVSKNFDPNVTDETGRETTPDQGKVFKFDYVASSGQNYGTAVALIGDDKELMLFFGDNLGKSMEDESDKDEWFAFLQQLSKFATRHNFHTFTPKNLNAIKHTMAGMAAIKEGLFEGYYGTRRVSYMGERTDARLVINHNRVLGENDKRYRYVESLFIETAEGERYKLPFTKLVGGRAMLEHVRQGGRPYDVRGVHIAETVQEMAVLARFNRANQGRIFEGDTQQLVEAAQNYYHSLQSNLKHMSSSRGYFNYFESWSPADIGEQESLVEDLRNMFVEQTLDTRIEAALPTLAKIQSGSVMKEAEQFESWANRMVEGTWALPETPEAKDKLYSMLNSELPVGPDAANATEQLYDIFGDDILFDRLSELADRDANADARPVVIARMKELGLEVPGVKDDPEINEADDTSTFECGATVAGAIAPLEEAFGSNYAEQLAQQVYDNDPELDASGEAGEVMDAGFVIAQQQMGTKRAQSIFAYDEDFPGDFVSAYAYLQQGGAAHVAEGNETPEKELERLKLRQNAWKKAPLRDQAATQARIRELEKQIKGNVAEGSEQQYSVLIDAVDHGVLGAIKVIAGSPQEAKQKAIEIASRSYLQRGYKLTIRSAVARPVSTGVAEDSTDPMDHRGAVTDSFYEDLDRLKKLAFVKRT